MSYPINYPTPQGANVQIFTAGGVLVNGGVFRDWVKPQGASFVWFTLIGAGGVGDGAQGGGSGAVTNFMCPAFLIPDVLRVRVAEGISSADNTTVSYQQKDGTGYTLLTAARANGVNAGTAMTANAFTAMGFFQSVAGQAGATGNVSEATNTFLSGGGSNGGSQISNYGYSSGPANTARSGTFQIQPIIVGTSGMGTGRGGVGCGGGLDGNNGGPGLAVIITW